METKNQRQWLVVWFGIFGMLLLASGCTPRENTLHLQPGRQLQALPASEGRPLVRLDLFTEERGGERGVIGGHVFRSERQLLLVQEGETARALRRMIGQQLTTHNIPFIHGEEPPAGSRRAEPAASGGPEVSMVVDGSISRLWLEVESGVVHSNYVIMLEVASRLHLPAEEKVVSRVVHVSEEMMKFSSRPEEMESFLDNSLEEAARQIVLKIVEHVGAGR